MTLDTKRTFDALVERHAQDEAARKRILGNRFYREISAALAGSHEYMAMEKLLELSADERFDLVVLDTPPTRHALDFLEAPDRLLSFLDSSVLRYFLRPYFVAGRLTLKVATRTGALALKLADRFLGLQFLQDLSEFFLAFESMYDGFKERAEKVYALLRDEAPAFVLVAGPAAAALGEALYFHGRLEEKRMPFVAFVVNRTHPLPEAGARRAPRGAPPAPRPRASRSACGPCARTTGALGRAEAKAVGRLEVDTGEPPLLVPEMEADVHDLRGLDEVAAALLPVLAMRILLYSGKGGVGKTSLSAATAVRAAKLGKRTLVVSTDSAHSLADALDRPVGPEPVAIAPRLEAVEIDVNVELESHWGVIHDYLTRFMTFKGVEETVAEEMAILPGMEELFSLLKVKRWADSGRYDAIVIDCAPTGDTVRMLGVPEILELLLHPDLPHPAHGRAHGPAHGPADDRHADPQRRRLRGRAVALRRAAGHGAAPPGPPAQLDPDRAEPREDGHQRVAAALHLPEPLRLPGGRGDRQPRAARGGAVEVLRPAGSTSRRATWPPRARPSSPCPSSRPGSSTARWSGSSCSTSSAGTSSARPTPRRCCSRRSRSRSRRRARGTRSTSGSPLPTRSGSRSSPGVTSSSCRWTIRSGTSCCRDRWRAAAC